MQTVEKAIPQISSHSVEEFLRDNPDFFVGREELLDALTLSHEEKGSVSLVEIKLQRQREQLQSAQVEQQKLLNLISHNDRTLRHFIQAEKRMLFAHCGEQVLSVLEYGAEQLKLKAGLGIQDHQNSAVTVSKENWQRFKSQHLGERGVYLGRLKRSDSELLFGDKAANFDLGSFVIISFEHPELEGFLSFYSEDGGHFEPSQDTLYLGHLAMVTAHQIRQLPWQTVQTLHAESCT